MSETINHRPYNSIRFICNCGTRHAFPRSPKRSEGKTSDVTFKSGIRHVVSESYKEVHCPCGLVTVKERRSFKGR